MSLEMVQGAVAVAAAWLAWLAGKHGWKWVIATMRAKAVAGNAEIEALKARIAALEAAAKPQA